MSSLHHRSLVTEGMQLFRIGKLLLADGSLVQARAVLGSAQEALHVTHGGTHPVVLEVTRMLNDAIIEVASMTQPASA